MTDTVLFTSIALVLVFSFSNGMKDGCNVTATAVASRSFSRRNAMIIVLCAEFLSPFVLGTPVAITVARGIIKIDILPHGGESVLLILSGITGALLWNIMTWAVRMPTSSSFALVGGLIGPVLFRFGMTAVPWKIFCTRVIGALFLSPLFGVLFGYLSYRGLEFFLRDASFSATKYIMKGQIASLIFLGLNHGSNDSQKAMGIIALLLFLAGKTSQIQIAPWMKIVSISSLVLGITMGGVKIIKTVGYDIFQLRPIHSLSSHISASVVLLFSNLIGAPVSTTQVITSSVMGVGSAFRVKSVRWSLIFIIIWSWILTIPLSAFVSIVIYITITFILGKTG